MGARDTCCAASVQRVPELVPLALARTVSRQPGLPPRAAQLHRWRQPASRRRSRACSRRCTRGLSCRHSGDEQERAGARCERVERVLSPACRDVCIFRAARDDRAGTHRRRRDRRRVRARRSPARPRVRGPRSRRVALRPRRRGGRDSSTAGSCRSTSRGAARCCAEVLAAGRAPGHHRARRRSRDADTRRGRHRHADRRAPQPRPPRGARRDRGHRRPASATASSSCCAAPCTRASPRWSSASSQRLGLDVDVAFCPERIAEGKAMVELFELPQIVAARTERGARTCDEAVPHARATRSCTSSPRKPSSRSCSRTRGATSSSRPRTSCS